MNRLIKWIIGIAAVLCALFAGAIQLVLPGMLDKAVPYVEKMAADYINGTVEIGSVTRPVGFTLLVKDIVVKDQKQQLAASVPEALITVSPLKGLTGLEKAVSAIEMKKPVVYIRQD